jgi:Holliday junction resolvase RusA-like endonuclease
MVWRAKREAREQAGWLAKEAGVPAQPFQKAHITITFVSGDRIRRDIDNLFAAMKPYIDGIVDAGVIADDSALNVSYTIRYERGPEANTIIEIEEMG